MTVELERSATAGLTQALVTAGAAARAIGDDAYAFDREAAKLSLSAKTAAWMQSLATGEAYVEPAGVLPSFPNPAPVRGSGGTETVTDLPDGGRYTKVGA